LNERRASNSFAEEKALKERHQNENSQLFTQESKGFYMQNLQNKLKKFKVIFFYYFILFKYEGF